MRLSVVFIVSPIFVAGRWRDVVPYVVGLMRFPLAGIFLDAIAASFGLAQRKRRILLRRRS